MSAADPVAAAPSDWQDVGYYGAAALLGISHRTLREWVQKGLVPHYRTSPGPHGHVRFTFQDIQAIRARYRIEPAAAPSGQAPISAAAARRRERGAAILRRAEQRAAA